MLSFEILSRFHSAGYEEMYGYGAPPGGYGYGYDAYGYGPDPYGYGYGAPPVGGRGGRGGMPACFCFARALRESFSCIFWNFLSEKLQGGYVTAICDIPTIQFQQHVYIQWPYETGSIPA